MNIPDNTKLDTIEQIAAEEVTKADKRPWHITPYAQIRPEFTPYRQHRCDCPPDVGQRQRRLTASASTSATGTCLICGIRSEPAVVCDVKARIAAAQQTGGGSGAEASSSTSGQQASGGQTSGGSDE